MRRSDGPALRDTGALARAARRRPAWPVVLTWGSWWCVPCFLIYGVLYGSASDSRWHETGHGTFSPRRARTTSSTRSASFMRCRIRRSGGGATRATTPTPSSWAATRRSRRCGRHDWGGSCQPDRIGGRPHGHQGHGHPGDRTAERRGKELRPRIRASEGGPHGAHLTRHLRCHRGRLPRDAVPGSRSLIGLPRMYGAPYSTSTGSPSTPVSGRTCSTTASTPAPSR